MALPVRRAGVLGHPIQHSLSPVLHRAAYDALGMDWDYSAIDVTADGLAVFLDSLDPEWVGLSLTMPLKEAVIDLLTEVEPRAATVRAVNTVILDGSGRKGFNTDITGLQSILSDALIGPSSTATVVGAGATARSSVAALAAVGVPRVVLLARRSEAVAELAALADVLEICGEPGAWPPSLDALGADVVVSTAPADAAAGFPVPTRPGLLVDVLYHPWPTPLAAAWKESGGRVVGGLELLVRQAVAQVTLMTGRTPPVGVLRSAGSAALSASGGPAGRVGPGREDIAQAEQ
ncbi:MAG: shikimate dehydrogenase [Actinomycetia bacterium]|nr:shikimate dehydrogenase [Actinomycetes bacterium]